MKPFRPHLAISVDGGGIRGILCTRALEAVEQALGKPLSQTVELVAGTSTGSIIAAGLALGLSAAQMTAMYKTFGAEIFRKTLRYYLWPVMNYRYSHAPLQRELDKVSGGRTMGDLWTAARPVDLVVVTHDLHAARTRWIKSWKSEYQSMPVTTAVLASAAAPTYFPPVEGRYVDGGVGSFANPCFIAAWEAMYVLNWKPEETTLLSLGTGKLSEQASGLPIGKPDKYVSLQWIPVVLDTFMTDANDQQARIVDQFFTGLDFRRFQVLIEPISLDGIEKVDRLLQFGDQMGKMIMSDQTDPDLKEVVYKIAEPNQPAQPV